MALLSGGGYAEYVAVPKTHLIELPKDFPFEKVSFIQYDNIINRQLV